jgi:hypothetical protein
MSKHQLEADKRDDRLIEERTAREAAALPAPEAPNLEGSGDTAAAE